MEKFTGSGTNDRDGKNDLQHVQHFECDPAPAKQGVEERAVVEKAPCAGKLEAERKNDAPNHGGDEHAEVAARRTLGQKELDEFAACAVSSANDDGLKDKAGEEVFSIEAEHGDKLVVGQS